MVKARLIRVLALAAMLAMAPHAVAQQQPSRLIINNHTQATVDLSTLVDKKWQSRGRINPGASTVVSNVTNGQQFKAVWGANFRDHFVKLAFDRSYGGLQDVFNVK